jgi:LmbE family N-acetylglucosaminyl deacetylase
MAMPFPAQGKALFVSPHLDDAVFACAELIAQCPGSVVATLFAGVPENDAQVTEWDAKSGFHSGKQAILSRREEDRSALGILRARPVWLDFHDSQYQVPVSPLALSAALEANMLDVKPDMAFFPAGLFHSDHVLAHEAVLALLDRHPGVQYFMYEESSYRLVPGLLQRRLACLLKTGITATPVVPALQGAHAAQKREAVLCYASQLRAIDQTVPGGHADVFAAERFWRIERWQGREDKREDKRDE